MLLVTSESAKSMRIVCGFGLDRAGQMLDLCGQTPAGSGGLARPAQARPLGAIFDREAASPELGAQRVCFDEVTLCARALSRFEQSQGFGITLHGAAALPGEPEHRAEFGDEPRATAR